jgi:putative hydrolase of the HAD superfamily
MQNKIDLQQYTHLLIDLDDTIYPQGNGLWTLIGNRINQFLIEVMHFPAYRVPDLRQRLWAEYGTTLRGLQAEYSVDMDYYLDYVHDIPVEMILAPDPNIDRLLQLLPQKKVIFTNASAAHAHRVLRILGVQHHFECILDIYAMAPYCKPQEEAFQKALQRVNTSPQNCLLVDDSPANLDTAQSLGMGTIGVGKHHHPASLHIENILQLNEVFFH